MHIACIVNYHYHVFHVPRRFYSVNKTLLNFAEETDIEQPVRKHIDIDHCCHDAVNFRSMTQCFEIERTFSKEDVKYLERMNIGQVENVIWVEERLTRLTASTFGDVFCLNL